MRHRVLGAAFMLFLSIMAYGVYVGTIILISPWTGPQENTPQLLNDFLYYWDSILVLLIVNAIAAGIFSLLGYSSRLWVGAYILCATALVLGTFKSEVYVDSGLWMARKYMHYVMPALGALAGTWVAARVARSGHVRK